VELRPHIPYLAIGATGILGPQTSAPSSPLFPYILDLPVGQLRVLSILLLVLVFLKSSLFHDLLSRSYLQHCV